MIESIVVYLQGLPVWGVIIVTFLVAYIENLFPPAPSDVILVFLGTLVGLGTVGMTTMIGTATLGSVAGFATAYWIGRRYGTALIESRRVPFLSVELLLKVEGWFNKYHGLIIVANRFLSGTRAVISFAAGITKMPFLRTTLYCLVSAAAWNSLMVIIGKQLGANWRSVEGILATYGNVVTILIVTTLVVYFSWKYLKRRKERRSIT
jgi:membrane protein DedA with SNARE-associated domain